MSGLPLPRTRTDWVLTGISATLELLGLIWVARRWF